MRWARKTPNRVKSLAWPAIMKLISSVAFQLRRCQKDSCVKIWGSQQFIYRIYLFFRSQATSSPRVSLWSYRDLQAAGESAVNSYPVWCQLVQRMNGESCPAILPKADESSRDCSPLASRPLIILGRIGEFFFFAGLIHMCTSFTGVPDERKQESARFFRFWSSIQWS